MRSGSDDEQDRDASSSKQLLQSDFPVSQAKIRNSPNAGKVDEGWRKAGLDAITVPVGPAFLPRTVQKGMMVLR